MRLPNNVLSVYSLNVHGSLESKLENKDFVKEIDKFDIVFLSETWTNKKVN